MTTSRIEYLLNRYYSATATLGEESELRRLLSADNLPEKFHADRELILSLHSTDSNVTAPTDFADRISETIDKLSIVENNVKHRRLAWLVSAAASVAIIVATALFLFKGDFENVSSSSQKIATTTDTNLAPSVRHVNDTTQIAPLKSVLNGDKIASSNSRASRGKRHSSASTASTPVKSASSDESFYSYAQDDLTPEEIDALIRVEATLSQISAAIDNSLSQIGYFANE